jgi:hypothetical protein
MLPRIVRSPVEICLGKVHHRFPIGHATLQIEFDEEVACALEPDHVV